MNPVSTLTLQKPPSFSQTVKNAAYQIQRASSKATKVLANLPKALKIPLEAAVLSYAPGEWLGLKGAFTAATVWAETPKHLSLFLRNHPVGFLGRRWQLFNFSSPDPVQELTNLDQKIGIFERTQPPLFSSSTAHPISLSEPASVPQVNRDQEKITDQNFQILIKNVSYFSILKAMQKYGGVKEHDAASLFNLVNEASRSKNTSIWKIFSNHFGPKMTFWGKIKAFWIYLFLWEIPVIPKTIDAYLKTILKELRTHLKENEEKRTRFINGMLEDLDNFLEVYNGATETYVNDSARKGNLNAYRKSAINKMFPIGDGERGKTQEERRLDFCRKLSASFVDNFCPDVHFDFIGGGFVNKLFKYFLRNTILPNALVSLSEEGKQATQRHNIPFFLSLTKTMNEEVTKLRQKMGEGAPRVNPFFGVKNFEPIVKKFFRATDLADCNTVEEVKAKMEALKKPEKRVDAFLRNELQASMQKGLAVLFDYLSKSENTEELFSALFESVSHPFSGNLPVNDKQWEKMIIEYEGAKILLKQSVAALAKSMVQEAVQDKIRGSAVPQQIQEIANKIFQEHQQRGKETLKEMLAVLQRLVSKINDPSSDIRPELALMTETLKIFENIERIKISLNQDPPPEIATLPPADQEAILHPLLPLYDGMNRVMDILLSLQNLQNNYETRFKSLEILRRINQLLQENTFSELKIDKLSTLLKELELHSPTTAQRLKELIDVFSSTLKTWVSQQEALNAVYQLHRSSGPIDELVLCVQGNALPGFKKWQCLERIKKNVKVAFWEPAMQQKILRLVDTINKYNTLLNNRPDLEKDLKAPLLALISQRKMELENRQKEQKALFELSLSQARAIAGQVEESTAKHLQQHTQEIKKQALSLQREISKLNRLVETAKKEIHVHLTPDQMGQIGGILGFILGFAIGKIPHPAASAVGVALGAMSAMSVVNLKNLVKERKIKFGVPFLATGALAGLGAYHGLFLNRIKEIAFAPMLLSGAALSLGFEYVGRKMTKRAIDVGVDLTMPKATEMFEKAYEHFLTNDLVIQGFARLLMRQTIELFPPKK